MINEIMNRRSVRVFEDREVESEKIINCLRAAMQSPSARNNQPWEFIVINDESTIKNLENISNGTKLPTNTAKTIVAFVLNNQTEFPEFLPQDMGACVENFMLQAVAEGLGTVWMGMYPRVDSINKLAEILNIPEGYSAFSLVAVGYPTKDNTNRFIDRFNESKIHYEKW